MTLHLGKVKPGSTIYIPFDTFAGSTGASITMTGLATSDILIYKSGGTTQRASTTGYTLLDTDGIDFDGVTGIHGISIDLSSNATADFYNAGAMYWVVISTITVDSQTVSFIAATFTIGYEGAILDTTIATLSSQTSFTLTAGPAEDDALNGCEVVIHDIASAVQAGRAFVSDYTGSTKTVTLVAGTTFTAAAGDNISVFLSALQPTVQGRSLDVSSGGEAGLDWANVWSPTTAVYLSDTNIDTDQVVASVSGAVGSVTGAVGSVTGNVGGNVTGSVGSVASGGITAASIATDAIDADALADGAITAATFAAGAITATVIADNAIDAGSIAADAFTAAKFASDVTTEFQAGLATAAALADVQTDADTIITTLGTPAGASISADIAAIEAQTDDIGVAGAGLTAIPWNAAWDAEVQSEVTDALVAASLDKLVLTSGTADSGSTTTMVDSARTEADNDYWKGRIILFTSGNIAGQCAIVTDFVAATDTLTFAPALTQAVSTQTYVILPGLSVWDDTLAEHLASGSTGAALNGATAPTAAAVADAVWDEALSGHLGAGSTGEALNAAGAAGDPWTTALPGAYGAGSAGSIIGNNLNATVSSRATPAQVNTEADTALADVGLTTTITGRIDAAVSTRASQTSVDTLDDFVDTEVGTILTRLGTPSDLGSGATVAANLVDIEAQTDDIGTAGAGLTALGDTRIANLDATVSSRATPAQVNTEADTALADVGLTTTVTGRIDVATSTRLASAGYTAPDNASIASILTDTGTDIPATLATLALQSSVDSLEAGVTLSTAGIDAILDRSNGVETGYTLRQALRLMAAALLGELSGAATTTIVIRDMGDTKTRITATVDADGNRSALSLDAS